MASDFRHAGHATFLLKIREGNHPTPDITVQKHSGILLFYIYHLIHRNRHPNGFILEHGPRLFTSAPLKCPRIDGYCPQLKAGCLLKHPSGVPDELQTTFLPLMTESPRFQTRLSITCFLTRAELMPLIPLTLVSVARYSNPRLSRAFISDHKPHFHLGVLTVPDIVPP